ncbi:LAME_0H18668g1_1 [Lachancea meyersii CBS 8951]|uniref:LAME_0H18668g1_1 n=1 Tax=Lachancea meyersii CBS 8951 TaxID=1266667 RepID=A0A1G4KIS9_9SACH|nr:LAME_0H18668g1_1 [Lachancea meyersii CBS 8951]
MLRKMMPTFKFYDIGLNLTDPMYQGIYNGKKYHECDIKNVLHRAKLSRVQNMLLTGSSIQESQDAIQLAHQFHNEDVNLYYTIGVHPCCVNEFILKDTQSTIDNPTDDVEFNAKLDVSDLSFTKSKLRELYKLISENSTDPQFRAIGEIGLDYDRFYYSSQKMQLLFFEEQLKLSCLFPNLPLFLHMRNCCSDFIEILKKFVTGFVDNTDRFDVKDLLKDIKSTQQGLPSLKESGGVHYKFSPQRKFVTHSFTGSVEDLQDIMALSENSYIGMNGCSFKTQENIKCLKAVSLDRLLLETDAPWCDIRRTHESYKYLFEDSAREAGADDPWSLGLSQAYPDIQDWFKSVKRDKLHKKSIEERAQTTVKSRNEPCFMGHVATVVANVKEIPIEDVANKVWDVTCKVYGQ